LSLAEREEISRGLAAGHSLRVIAAALGRAPSTVSREVAGNGGPRGYRALCADRAAWARATRPKRCKLARAPGLRDMVAEKLGRRWSPQQIAGWLKLTYPERPEMQVSHETIYRTLYVQSRGALRRELSRYLRTGRGIRHPRGVRLPDGRGGRPNTLHISQRPAEAEDRAVPGHWEGDLVFGKAMSPVATLVERSTRFLILVALPGGNHKAEAVADALAAAIMTLPQQLTKSLTWDQGHEMADHARFTVVTGVQVYFCDPKSPWQRGSNENTNGLLRQYLPKGTDLSVYTLADLDAIADKLNGRPRKTLQFRTPAEELDRLLSDDQLAGVATTN
jgi:IS30 family transposase